MLKDWSAKRSVPKCSFKKTFFNVDTLMFRTSKNILSYLALNEFQEKSKEG